MYINKIIAEELKINEKQVEKTVELIDEGNTIPFIARYRKEVTGNLSDEILRQLDERLTYLRNLEKRKEEVLELIDGQGKLTEEIKKDLALAMTLAEVEDIYRPYKQKKKTRATEAKANGLEPLAKEILKQRKINIYKEASKYVNEKVPDEIAALSGAKDIIAEQISDDPNYRKDIKSIYARTGIIETKVASEEIKETNTTYEMYYDYSEKLSKIVSHRILAINRGEKEEVLKVKLLVDDNNIMFKITRNIIKDKSYLKNINFDNVKIDAIDENITENELIVQAVKDSWIRLLEPSVAREIRSDLTEKAETQAIKVFSKNAKQLLLGAPLKDLVILGYDPGYRTGSKIAIIDETGKVLDTGVVYPVEPQNEVEKSRKILFDMFDKHNVNMIAIGNGTASRESESFIADTIKMYFEKTNKKIYYTIVSEAGASVYSASKLATEEYPELNVSLRGAISIAKRLQDPLAEFVKIDPKAIGIGQYQHDVNQKRLSETLGTVVEDAVNQVGVDLNTATASLLKYVAGINASVAKNIITYREENGKFKERKELLKVAKLGQKTYEQCAGFTRITDGKNPIELTGVHPERYKETEELLKTIGYKKEDIKDKEKLEEIVKKLNSLDIKQTAKQLNIGEITLEDIIKEISKPGRDPREDMPKPILRSDILKFEDLKCGEILKGTVRNVTDFGAFVDIGIKNDALVHISEMSEKFIKHPLDVVSVGDIIDVKVKEIDDRKKQLSLTMKI